MSTAPVTVSAAAGGNSPAGSASTSAKVLPTAVERASKTSRAASVLKSGVVYGGSAILSAVNGITPHLAGAVDIVVVQQPDGSLKSTPFYVRFGKYTPLRNKERTVKLYVNGQLSNFSMHLGSYGQAYFAVETTQPLTDAEAEEEEAILAGMMSPPSGYSSGGEDAPYVRKPVLPIDELEAAAAEVVAAQDPAAGEVAHGAGASGSKIVDNKDVETLGSVLDLLLPDAGADTLASTATRRLKPTDLDLAPLLTAAAETGVEPLEVVPDLGLAGFLASPSSSLSLQPSGSSVGSLVRPGGVSLSTSFDSGMPSRTPSTAVQLSGHSLDSMQPASGGSSSPGVLSAQRQHASAHAHSNLGNTSEVPAGQLNEQSLGVSTSLGSTQSTAASGLAPAVQPKLTSSLSEFLSLSANLDPDMAMGVAAATSSLSPHAPPSPPMPHVSAFADVQEQPSQAMALHSAEATLAAPPNSKLSAPDSAMLPRTDDSSSHASPAAVPSAMNVATPEGDRPTDAQQLISENKGMAWSGASSHPATQLGPSSQHHQHHKQQSEQARQPDQMQQQQQPHHHLGQKHDHPPHPQLPQPQPASSITSATEPRPTSRSLLSAGLHTLQGGVSKLATTAQAAALSIAAAASAAAEASSVVLPDLSGNVDRHHAFVMEADEPGTDAQALRVPASDRANLFATPDTLTVAVEETASDASPSASPTKVPIATFTAPTEPMTIPHRRSNSAGHLPQILDQNGPVAASTSPGTPPGATSAHAAVTADGSFGKHRHKRPPPPHHSTSAPDAQLEVQDATASIAPSARAVDISLPPSSAPASSTHEPSDPAALADGYLADVDRAASPLPHHTARSIGGGMRMALPGGGGGLQGLELSLCGALLRADMPYAYAVTLFDASRLDADAFVARGAEVADSPDLVVRVGGAMYRWSAVAPLMLGLLVYGTTWVQLLPPDVQCWLPEGVASAEEPLKSAASCKKSPSSGTWGSLWPFSGWYDRSGSATATAGSSAKSTGGSPPHPSALLLSSGKQSSIPGLRPIGSSGIPSQTSLQRGTSAHAGAEDARDSRESAAEPGQSFTGGSFSAVPSGRSESGISAATAGSAPAGGSGGRGRSKKHVVLTKKTLTPTSEQLMTLPLHEGQNTVVFRIGAFTELRAYIYFLNWRNKIVISDVDGTITRSDMLGHLLPAIGLDWSHPGIARLLTNIHSNGYVVMYLSSRAISQANITREFINTLVQGQHRMPVGPVIISPHGLLPSLYREMILRRPHEFKIATLQEIRALFPPEWDPFYAGLGNRDTDEISYREVGVPASRVFIINPKGELRRATLAVQSSTWSSLTSINELVHEIFPAISRRAHSHTNPITNSSFTGGGATIVPLQQQLQQNVNQHDGTISPQGEHVQRRSSQSGTPAASAAIVGAVDTAGRTSGTPHSASDSEISKSCQDVGSKAATNLPGADGISNSKPPVDFSAATHGNSSQSNSVSQPQPACFPSAALSAASAPANLLASAAPTSAAKNSSSLISSSLTSWMRSGSNGRGGASTAMAAAAAAALHPCASTPVISQERTCLQPPLHPLQHISALDEREEYNDLQYWGSSGGMLGAMGVDVDALEEEIAAQSRRSSLGSAPHDFIRDYNPFAT